MALWRDPLDELIDDLERVAPDTRSNVSLFPIEKLQQLIDAILYGRNEEVESLKADPAYQRWVAHLAEMRRHTHAERSLASGLASLDRTAPATNPRHGSAPSPSLEPAKSAVDSGARRTQPQGPEDGHDGPTRS